MKKLSYYLECIECGFSFDVKKVIYTCRNCDGLLSVKYNTSLSPSRMTSSWEKRRLSVWRYIELLPVENRKKIVSMGEGGTNLDRVRRLFKNLGLKNIYVKNEGSNPTGSFKDRGMTVGVTKALELGMDRVICASTGNTSASLAAYAAKAGIECIVLIPSGKVALGKMVQALAHNAKVIQVKGNFDQSLRIVREICLTYPIYLLNSINPFRLEGQKTIAFEINDQLRANVPDKIIVPVGNAGNISAIWKGFNELYELGLIKSLPQMIGIQAEGAAPIANSIKRNLEDIEFVDKPDTAATAIRIGSPVNWKKAIKAINDSKGIAETVSDDEIIKAQRMLAELEGIFVEPASAASIAGLLKLYDIGFIDKEENVICIVTGHGLKDPNIILKQFPKPIEVEPKKDSIVKLIYHKEDFYESFIETPLT